MLALAFLVMVGITTVVVAAANRLAKNFKRLRTWARKLADGGLA